MRSVPSCSMSLLPMLLAQMFLWAPRMVEMSQGLSLILTIVVVVPLRKLMGWKRKEQRGFKTKRIACIRNLQKRHKSSSQGIGMWTRCKYGPCHWLCCPSPVPLARFQKLLLNVSQINFCQGSRGPEKVSAPQIIISQGSRGSEKALIKKDQCTVRGCKSLWMRLSF